MNVAAAQVDFYILKTNTLQDKLLFICRLIEKIYQQDLKVYVYAPNKEEAQALDELLWTYKEDSFLPHHLSHKKTSTPAPIQIGGDDHAAPHMDVLINLDGSVPDFYQHYARIIELVLKDATYEKLARERFKFYRAKNLNINTHQLAVN